MSFECKCGKSKIVTKRELYAKLTNAPKPPMTLADLADAWFARLLSTN